MKTPTIDRIEYYIIRGTALLLLLFGVVRLIFNELRTFFY